MPRIGPEHESGFLRIGVPPGPAAGVASEVARSFSGVGLWPRLGLDAGGGGARTRTAPGGGDDAGGDDAGSGDAGSGDAGAALIVAARGPRGEPSSSHWQTVLPLLSNAPRPVRAGDVLRVEWRSTTDEAPETPSAYALSVTMPEEER